MPQGMSGGPQTHDSYPHLLLPQQGRMQELCATRLVPLRGFGGKQKLTLHLIPIHAQKLLSCPRKLSGKGHGG